jgi:hypothetical protein
MKYSSDMPLGSIQEATQTIAQLANIDRISSWGHESAGDELKEDEAVQRLKSQPEKYIASIRGALPSQ